jgi:hypothetical protein
MKLVKTLIAIAAIGVGSQAFGKAYPSLEVGFTFREVALIVEDPGEHAKKIGLTEEDIERTVKLKLLTRGFKVIPEGEFSPTGSYLHIESHVVGSAFRLRVNLSKYSAHFGIPYNRGTGTSFDPSQGSYSSTGTHGGDKKFILEWLEGVLDRFILDYLESNLKYEATLKDKKLRDIDRVIKGAADAEAKSGLLYPAQTAWYKRYNALMKEK